MTTFTIKKAQWLPSQEFETITDAIYFLTVHGLKPKKSPLDDDPDWIYTTPKNRLAYLDRKKEDYIAFEDFLLHNNV